MSLTIPFNERCRELFPDIWKDLSKLDHLGVTLKNATSGESISKLDISTQGFTVRPILASSASCIDGCPGNVWAVAQDNNGVNVPLSFPIESGTEISFRGETTVSARIWGSKSTLPTFSYEGIVRSTEDGPEDAGTRIEVMLAERWPLRLEWLLKNLFDIESLREMLWQKYRVSLHISAPLNKNSGRQMPDISTHSDQNSAGTPVFNCWQKIFKRRRKRISAPLQIVSSVDMCFRVSSLLRASFSGFLKDQVLLKQFIYTLIFRMHRVDFGRSFSCY